MNEKPLTESVIKKIQMAKLLYDLGTDCFQISENPEKIGVGIVLLQDSVEIFLIATWEHLEIKQTHKSKPDKITFPEYFDELEKETGKAVPLKRQLLKINKQRVNVKHYGMLPHIDDCKNFSSDVRTFFIASSDSFLETDFDTITLADLLRDGDTKELLKRAEVCLETGDYRECQINCRKTLYLTYEKMFDVRPKEGSMSLASVLMGSYAYFYAQNKKDIEEKVKDPTDYIVIDFNRLNNDLLLDGIIPTDFWNIRNLTPEMYYYEDDKEWVVEDEFKDGMYNEGNAEYCFRKTVEILLLKQRNQDRKRYVELGFKSIKFKQKEVKVFEKADSNSKIALKLESEPSTIISSGRVRGLYDKKQYYRVFDEIEKEGKKVFVAGYVCEDDVEKVL